MAAAETRVAVITFADHYVGPPALAFALPAERSAFEAKHPGVVAAEAAEPQGVVAEALRRFGRLDAVVSNDVPLERREGEVRGIDRTDFAKVVDLLLVRPHAFASAAIAAMNAGDRGGSLVMVTSGATTRLPYYPSDGNEGYVSARNGVNAMARCLAVKHAAQGVQVNVIAPFYLYSQLAFPSAIGAEDPAYQERVQANIPAGRFGRPEEVGELVTFLCSGRSRFTTGQVIAFSGGGA